MAQEQSTEKTISTAIATVVSDKMQKSRIVKVERTIRHPRYGRTMKRVAKRCVHDENNDTRKGDLVRIAETNPISRTKSWKIVEVLHRAQ